MESETVLTPVLKTSSEPLSKLHVTGLCLLLAVVILFGAMVEFRGALANRRMTDIGPYLRAAWSVRTGGDMYKITDDNDWHYLYPPVFAILMTPLADPPHGEDRTGYLPYALSVGIWYVITMALGAIGIGILARTMEDPFRNLAAGRGRRFSLRWWALRTAPLLVLLPAIGRCQMRGQVGLLIVFLFCCFAAAILKGRRFRAGLWLSGAICVKVFPAVILVFALWRRDWRMLSGSAAGLLVGLILLPLIVLGPERTVASYKSFYQEIVVAGIRGDSGGTRGAELTGITSTDSNSPMVVLHNIMNPDKKNPPEDGPSGRARCALGDSFYHAGNYPACFRMEGPMVFGKSGCDHGGGLLHLCLYPVDVCGKPCIPSSLRFDGCPAGDGAPCHALGEVFIRAYSSRVAGCVLVHCSEPSF